MSPAYSPVEILTALGLGQYTAAAVALLGFGGFILAHIFPFVPQPSATTNGFLVFAWKIGNALTGGYGNAKPSATVPVPATVAQVPPAAPIAVAAAV